MPPVLRERERFRAEIGEGGSHSRKIGPHGFVALHVDAADFARAVVEVEIGGELVVFGRGGWQRLVPVRRSSPVRPGPLRRAAEPCGSGVKPKCSST